MEEKQRGSGLEHVDRRQGPNGPEVCTDGGFFIQPLFVRRVHSRDWDRFIKCVKALVRSSLEYKRFINTPTRDDQVGNSREFGNPGNRQSAECMDRKSAESVDRKSAESVDRKSAESVDRFEKWEYPEIEEGKPTKYNWVVQHKDNLKLGYKTDIGAFSYINAEYGVIIEDLVQIGSHCSIYSISTIDKKQGKVTLRKNCKIGSHSVVMPGVTVGENSIVGAFSFVNSNVPDNVVAVGVPARVIKSINK